MSYSPEFQHLPEIKTFSEGVRNTLEREGYVTYNLTGRSTIDLQKEFGFPFEYDSWQKNYPQFMDKTSMRTQVAINPNAPFLDDSNNRTLEQQQLLISAYSLLIGEEIVGVEAVMGNAADYVELIFAHFNSTGNQLFEPFMGGARTKTVITSEDHVANVRHQGYIPPRVSAQITGYRGRLTTPNLYACPLIIPKSLNASSLIR